MTSAAIDPYDAPRDLSSLDDLAGYGSRFAARVVDNLVGLSTLIPGVLSVFLVGGPEALEREPIAAVVVVVGVLFTLALMITVAATQWFWLATRGQSIGKRFVGIHIVKVDGSPADFVSAVLLRTLAPGLVIGLANQLCLGWVLILADVLPAFGSERRCIHDLMAGTKVVEGFPTHLA